MKKIGLALLFLVCLNGYAANWQPVASGGGQEIFVDSSSIMRVNNFYRAWTVINFDTPDNVPGGAFKYLSDKSLFFYDCANKKFGKVTQILYSEPNGGGRSQVTYSVPTRDIVFDKAAPDTIAETMLNFVCGHTVTSRR